ncbi:hypothetical protein Ga0100231_001120 [Opitutaceae bacterium TAV4]|nr:hypothetical protein Ga0100230_011685 [Opitutaceae bacterium TAV3]RRK01437.1 hypothetical protein Ga0100231_001120 [Opitutaceae bacterium TAV4]
MSTTRSKTHPRSLLAALSALLAAAALATSGSLHAATITALKHGKSFTDATVWSNGQLPSSDNDYFANSFRIETANDALDYTFGGKSLTLDQNGHLRLFGSGTITINDLRFGGSGSGKIQSWSDSLIPHVAGTMTLTSYGVIEPGAGRTIKISSTINGVDKNAYLEIRTGTVQLVGGVINCEKATYITSGHLQALADGILRSVRLDSVNAKFTLSGGTTHNYINDSADLILVSNMPAGAVDLSFVGTDIIGRLSLDGGTTWLADGTYGSLTSTAQHKFEVFAGSGILQIGTSNIPEVSTSALIAALGVALTVVVFRRRRA